MQRIPFPWESGNPVPSSGTQAQDVPSFYQSRIPGYQIYPLETGTQLLPNESSFHMTAEQETELSMYRLRQMSNHEQLPVMNFDGMSPVFQFDCYHSEIPEDQMYPMVTEDGSPANQSRFYNKIALCKTAEQERRSSVYRLRQMSNQYQLPVMSLNRTLSANQFVSQKAFYEIAYPVADVAAPSGQVNSHGALPLHYLDSSQPQKPHYSSHESQQVNPKQIQKITSVPHRMATTLPRTSHVPMFAGGSNQRPSVIMVPISLMTTVSFYDHEGEKVEADSSSNNSDLTDEEKDSYFRVIIDGKTTKFKLTKEDWERIHINTFPSGGRLLSGDWTRIFLSKLKESNPWCSLRFKNNHVRSENSRKIHSAVFFRGGAECKRPECNVKVRLVIQKEKGKHVDVTYMGNVCHSIEPGDDDFKQKQIRRNYSSRAEF